MILETADDLANDPFRVFPEIWVEKVVILSHAIVSRRIQRRIAGRIRIRQGRRGSGMTHNNVGMLLIKPGRDRIRGRAKNDSYPSLVQAIQYPLHPGKLEISITGLPTAPGRFAHTNHRNSRFLHHLDIFVEPVVGHVFWVIRHTIKDGFHLVGSEGRHVLRQDAGRDERKNGACWNEDSADMFKQTSLPTARAGGFGADCHLFFHFANIKTEERKRSGWSAPARLLVQKYRCSPSWRVRRP